MKGTLLKLEGHLSSDNFVEYRLPIGKERLEMNELIGKALTLKYTGNIYCIASGEKISKPYHNGYSYESFIRLAACDRCIFEPEKCHYHLGTCREPLWGEEHCMQPHIVYLANSSHIKVGITRKSQVPTRWIDQGAVQAIALFQVKNRLVSGLVEVKLKEHFSDKTNWRAMLKNEVEEVNLQEEKKKALKLLEGLITDYDLEILEEGVTNIRFPVKDQWPEKIRSLSFDKLDTISDRLIGIKGQYLIFENGVLNIRRHQGYEVELIVG